MSTDDVLLLRRDAHFYIDKVCGTFPFTHQQNAEKVPERFTIKQNAKKVSETKKEARRRTPVTSKAS